MTALLFCINILIWSIGWKSNHEKVTMIISTFMVLMVLMNLAGLLLVLQ